MTFFAITNISQDKLDKTTEVIKAIDELISVVSLDTVRRTYAAAVSHALQKEWGESLGLKRFKGRPCLHQLLGQKCPSMESFSLMPPHSDHVSLWMKDGKPFCLVSQPYGLSMLQIEEIGEFCHKHGLVFKIDSWPGWHFPHAVLFITFTPAQAPA